MAGKTIPKDGRVGAQTTPKDRRVGEQTTPKDGRVGAQTTPKDAEQTTKKNSAVRAGRKKGKGRLLQDCMRHLLDMPVTKAEDLERLAALGVPAAQRDNRTMLAVALYAKAAATGDVSAFREIRNLLGEDGTAEQDGQLERLLRGLKEE